MDQDYQEVGSVNTRISSFPRLLVRQHGFFANDSNK
jgi:hypothetical protein